MGLSAALLVRSLERAAPFFGATAIWAAVLIVCGGAAGAGSTEIRGLPMLMKSSTTSPLFVIGAIAWVGICGGFGAGASKCEVRAGAKVGAEVARSVTTSISFSEVLSEAAASVVICGGGVGVGCAKTADEALLEISFLIAKVGAEVGTSLSGVSLKKLFAILSIVLLAIARPFAKGLAVRTAAMSSVRTGAVAVICSDAAGAGCAGTPGLLLPGVPLVAALGVMEIGTVTLV